MKTTVPSSNLSAMDTELLESRFSAIRGFSDKLVEPLSAEDCMIQSMDDVSPTRWHLAHTTWFFETFALRDEPGYEVFDESYNYLFNSYYNTIGEQFPRSKRGLISRPGLDEIREYRRHVDGQIEERLRSDEYVHRMFPVLRVGLQHEQQHQELMLTDIKHVLSYNPTFPAYHEHEFDRVTETRSEDVPIEAGNYDIGHQGNAFAFDNEYPRHRVFLGECSLSRNLVTCGEYLQFMEEGGYARPEFWLSLGWSTVQQEGWTAPLYWTRKDGQWMQFTLAGLVPINPDWPVCHVSLFEADAFARWSGKRLPTEFEWEIAAFKSVAERAKRFGGRAEKCEAGPKALAASATADVEEPFADVLLNNAKAFHPTRSPSGMMGGLWQWTSSSYAAYPGYKPPAGAIGEYNGKFMCNQYVLRGGSIATHSTHIRPTYRNFFPAHARWQFTGIRLAE